MIAGSIFIDLLALALGANDDGREAGRPACAAPCSSRFAHIFVR
jgi:hypothetical protein